MTAGEPAGVVGVVRWEGEAWSFRPRDSSPRLGGELYMAGQYSPASASFLEGVRFGFIGGVCSGFSFGVDGGDRGASESGVPGRLLDDAAAGARLCVALL